VGEILLSRYDLDIENKFKTHITSNLNAKELEKRYGNRVRSLMRAMFNLISFDEVSKDKKQKKGFHLLRPLKKPLFFSNHFKKGIN